MIIVVDSDGLIGLSQKDDAHHSSSTRILQKLNKEQVQFIYPATTIAETTAILQIRLNKPDTANRIIENVKQGIFQVEPIDQSIIISAAAFLKKDRSKHVTLFDGIVAAIAQKHKADAIFSFDDFYSKNGFKLASEI